jgi:O-antigen/teichoic acid export membrane protein
MLPMGQTLTVLAILLLPTISQNAISGGGAYLRRVAFKISMVLGGLTLCYVGLALAFGPSLLSFLYGGDKYLASAWLLPVYGIVIFLRSVSDCGMGLALRAAGRSDLLFYSAAGAACTTILVGTSLVTLYGLEGAAAGLILSALVQFGTITVSLRRLIRGTSPA